MNSILNTFFRYMPSIYSAFTDQMTTYDDVDMFLVDLPWNLQDEMGSTQIVENRGAQTEDAGEDVEKEGHDVERGTPGCKVQTGDKGFAGQRKNKYDFEEKDYMYDMPTCTYRSGEPYFWKEESGEDTQRRRTDAEDGDKQTKTGDSGAEHMSSSDEKIEPANDGECAGFKVEDGDKDSSYSWNIRDDYEEKEYVYNMPSDTYRSYEPDYWKNGDDNEVDSADGANANIDQETNPQSLKTLADEEDADLTTPKTMANIPPKPCDNIDRKHLCRVCRLFYDAKDEELVSMKKCLPFGKHLFRRKKLHGVPCDQCRFAVDRRSFLKRLFGIGRNHGGTY